MSRQIKNAEAAAKPAAQANSESIYPVGPSAEWRERQEKARPTPPKVANSKPTTRQP